jgi:hypothetical protein
VPTERRACSVASLFTSCREEVFSETDQTGAKAIVSIKSVSRAEPVIASVRGQL